ncbi:Duf1479 domain protein [Mycena kentingensis (nom. inval.)]|nr:Duf1479 domain protein [Mycena kentingensis (nom. inval.)]
MLRTGLCASRPTSRSIHRRSLATMSAMTTGTRGPKGEGDISAVFSSLRPTDPAAVFPARFREMKRELWDASGGQLRESWREVLGEVEMATERVARLGEKIIPRITMESVQRGLSTDEAEAIRAAGCVVVRGAVSKEARSPRLETRHSGLRRGEPLQGQGFTGFPPNDIQVYELYNTLSQMRARTHPNILATQKALLGLWKTSAAADEIDLATPVSYFDRLRIRGPGDTQFALGPHVDAGSIERWEDPDYRRCFAKILEGRWREYDPYDVEPRIHAKQDLYNAPNQCSIFRPWQGWTAMSSTGPGEGTLQVLPMLKLATAYWILRPFFKLRAGATPGSLAYADWKEVDLESSAFHGAGMGTGLELNDATHPHLKLARTMTAMPRVEPGDQVYWHCDMIHAVESKHGGKNDSSVLYIPAVPLTLDNANYLRDQRNNFLAGLPSPDFPSGEGESNFVGRGTDADIYPTTASRRSVGFGRFDDAGRLGRDANAILGL